MTGQGRASGPQKGSRLLLPVAVIVMVLALAALAWVLLDRDSGDGTTSKTPGALSGPRVVGVETTRRALAEGATAIDVRTAGEYAAGHLQDAKNIDLSAADFDQRIAALDPEADYVVYCASGRRAAEAIEQMQAAGFSGLLANAGGYEDLDSAGLDTQTG